MGSRIYIKLKLKNQDMKEMKDLEVDFSRDGIISKVYNFDYDKYTKISKEELENIYERVEQERLRYVINNKITRNTNLLEWLEDYNMIIREQVLLNWIINESFKYYDNGELVSSEFEYIFG